MGKQRWIEFPMNSETRKQIAKWKSKTRVRVNRMRGSRLMALLVHPSTRVRERTTCHNVAKTPSSDGQHLAGIMGGLPELA